MMNLFQHPGGSFREPIVRAPDGQLLVFGADDFVGAASRAAVTSDGFGLAAPPAARGRVLAQLLRRAGAPASLRQARPVRLSD